jgi:SAM-dependent methyltransferase
MSTGYALAYRFGITPWERAGKTADASFSALLDREEADRTSPWGRALDLGCGRGAHTHQLAHRGWQAIGIDNVARAIDAARQADSSSASFAVADVTTLRTQDLGTFDFFLDVGCFHGLRPEQRSAAAQAITAIANPGATMLMLAFQPNRAPLLPAGVTRTDITDAFTGWELLNSQPADTSGMPGPLKKTAPQWYRLRRPA